MTYNTKTSGKKLGRVSGSVRQWNVWKAASLRLITLITSVQHSEVFYQHFWLKVEIKIYYDPVKNSATTSLYLTYLWPDKLNWLTCTNCMKSYYRWNLAHFIVDHVISHALTRACDIKELWIMQSFREVALLTIDDISKGFSKCF